MTKRIKFAVIIAITCLTFTVGCRVVTPQQTLRTGVHFFPPTCPQFCR